MNARNWILLCLIIFIGIGTLEKVSYRKFSSTEIIGSDGVGYYMYLPAIFIYHDLSFSFKPRENKEIGNPIEYYKVVVPTKDGYSIAGKYTCGVALLLLPFFLIVSALSLLLHLPDDGYNALYQLMVFWAASIYVALGLFNLYLLMKKLILGNIAILISLIAVFFATNLFYYTYFEPSMSHAYSFCLIACFLFRAYQFICTENNKDFLILSGLYALIILVRPFNGVIVLALPFLFFLSGKKISNFFTLRIFRFVLLGALIFIPILSIQSILWYIQTGKFLIDSYGPNETFIFNDPHIKDILLSYRKGLFVYSPFLLLLLGGLAVLIFQKTKSGIAVSLFLLALVYLLSSWYAWSYSACFGPRPFIDFYPLIILVIAFFCNHFDKIGKLIISVFLLISIGLNFIQSYQYKTMIFANDSMTKESYWFVFLKTDATKYSFYRWSLHPEMFHQTEEELESDYLLFRKENIIQEIKKNEEWMKKIKEDATQKGVSIDSIIETNASQVLQEQLK